MNGGFDARPLADLRVDLVSQTTALSVADRQLSLERARAEARIIDRKGGDPKALGSNETERSRALLLELEEDPTYTTLRAQTEALRAQTEALRAEVETRVDERRELRRQTDEKLADAYFALAGSPNPLRPSDGQELPR